MYPDPWYLEYAVVPKGVTSVTSYKVEWCNVVPGMIWGGICVVHQLT